MSNNKYFDQYQALYSKYVESRVAVHNFHIRFSEYIGIESYYRLREHLRAIPVLEKEMLKVAKLAVMEQRNIAKAEKALAKQARQKKKFNKNAV
jgi:cell division protein FtsB